MFLIKKLHYLLFGVLFFGLFSLTSCSNKDADIISTVYPGYDFVKAVLGSDSSHTPGMLVKAGTEIHDFEPSAVNIHSIINSKLFITSAILIIGGGIGNLVDRIFLGYVVDFIKISFFPPAFNFADCCVTIGAVLMVIYLLFFTDFKDEKKING